MPNKVFISYRREDSRYQARRVYDAFVHALPPDTVFMDVDSIPPGADFVEILEGWVQQCDVLLALIGPNWLNSIDPRTGLRRVDSPDDFVRIEVRGALQRKIPVVPVLLDATEMPTAAELPDDIKALRRRHAEFVDFRTFDADVQRLIKRLKIGRKSELPPDSESQGEGGRRPPVILAALGIFKDAVAARPLLVAAAMVPLLLGLGAAAYVKSTRTPVDVAARSADLAKSEADRREAEARVKEATDTLASSDRARQGAEARAKEASDAFAKADGARQDAEAKANAAVAALDKAEESRLAAEGRAKIAEDALRKSEKARLEAEARATNAASAQAKAEEGQRAADKARFAAETAAAVAATAKAQADSGRQYAEVRANDAAEALKKSEKARQDAEAKLAAHMEELRKSSRQLHIELGNKSRWYVFGSGNCAAASDPNVLSLEVGVSEITWINGYGRRDSETILTSSENKFETDRAGSKRSYSRTGNSLFVQMSGKPSYFLDRCP